MATLLDKLRKKYTILARCKNCQTIQEISIPKGVSIEQFFGDGMGSCDNCGVNQLEVAPKNTKKKEEEYDAKNKKFFGQP